MHTLIYIVVVINILLIDNSHYNHVVWKKEVVHCIPNKYTIITIARYY